MSTLENVTLTSGSNDWWSTHRGASPIVATAIHNGHHVRDDVLGLMALADDERLREEDPFTEFFLRDLPNRIVVHRSRFEIDLNRARNGAIYLKPEQAWGLNVWSEPPAEDLTSASLAVHDAYYDMLNGYLHGVEKQFGAFVVLDLHSYNHRRNGPDAAPSAVEAAPEINIGTFSMDRKKWAPVVDEFIRALGSFEFQGRRIDVRENVAFEGKGEQTRFIHERFPATGCAIAVEFKKFFMDEWSGEPDVECLTALRRMVASTVPRLEAVLRDFR